MTVIDYKMPSNYWGSDTLVVTANMPTSTSTVATVNDIKIIRVYPPGF